MNDTDSTLQEWTRMSFKNHKVWVATDSAGNVRLDHGKAVIKYRLDQDYEYQIHASALHSLDEIVPNVPSPSRKSKKHVAEVASGIEMDENSIHIFTDGASSGNPGHSGIGVLMHYGKHEKEISRYIGVATNNIAELEAIRTGLLEVKKRDIPVKIYTDSSYAHGLLSLGWKATKNTGLVCEIRDLIKKFKNLRIVKVKGHCGVEQNEKADKLATSAIQTELAKTP